MPVNDADLRAALTEVLGRPVGELRRRAWPYASSVPLEELHVPGVDPILFKDLTPAPRPSRPPFLVEPQREVEAYTRLLGGLGAPELIGSVVAEDRVWLFLELVDGVPLWQADGPDAWTATARWMARLHARPVPDAEHLASYDARHHLRFLARALTMAPPGALQGVAAAVGHAVDRLQRLPACFLHGELYPSNVLIQDGPDGPRVRPIDWETAGIGPGVLDLAALIAGTWREEERDHIIASYREALPAPSPTFEGDLDAARLLVALQWLGWSDSWAPPPEHRHDWAADARALAARIRP